MAKRKVTALRDEKEKKEEEDVKALQRRMFMTLASMMVERAGYADRLGKSFGTDRDLYTVLGYTKTPSFNDYAARYDRGDIAKRIVNAYPSACWRKKPIITESIGEETEFEVAWRDLVKRLHIWHYLQRADKISGIGRYGVLFLGFNDGKNFKEPVEKASELLYLFPYNEENASIRSWDNETGSRRYNLPELYNLNMVRREAGSFTRAVHHSRVIHVAEELTGDDVYGTPRLKAILNRLQDLDLIAGGSAEMFWRGAFPGFGLKADADADFGTQELEDLETEIQNYMHNLQRYMRLRGIDIQELSPQVSDPSKHFEMLIKLISGTTGIPQRILLGSERGELASSQDEKAWNSRVSERREEFCEPVILRPFIDRLISVGVLPEPKDGYSVEWPPLLALSEKEEAEVEKARMEVLSKYLSAPGAEMLIPERFFLKKHLGYDDEDISEIETAMEAEFGAASEMASGIQEEGEE